MPVGLVLEPGALFVDLNPSGEWVAVDGRSVEVLVLDGRQKLQLSPGFGMEARWCSAGSALFYRNGHQIFSVGVQFEPTFAFQPAELAFEIEGFVDASRFSYDVSPDGQRLLVVKRQRQLPRSTIHLIEDWTASLEVDERQE